MASTRVVQHLKGNGHATTLLVIATNANARPRHFHSATSIALELIGTTVLVAFFLGEQSQ